MVPLFGANDIAQVKAKKPNILVIMGDDVGWFNIGAYQPRHARSLLR